ncbi:MAG: hypothetical protein E7620_01050 [Ruminococcaceae bacterium]|nr:hypothetical protein [Oscillospiraceae bacterium]
MNQVSQATPTQAPPAPEAPKNNRANIKKDAVKVYLFTGALLVFFVIGLLFFLRPTVSEEEKRTLTEFPQLTWEGLLSGEWFSGVSTWYADTFPMRDGFISINQAIKNLYGIRTMQIVQNPQTQIGNNPSNPTATPGDENDSAAVEKFDYVFVKGNRAFEIYSFSEEASNRYASIISEAAAKMPRQRVYNLIVPLSYSVNLTEREQKQIGAANIPNAIAYMYDRMSDAVTTIDLYPDLLAHKNEELYFRTDHHWTARGAYYAYAAYCRSTGQVPLPLDGWQKLTFEGFLGSLYRSAGKPAQLEKEPDVVEAWIPNSTNKMRTFLNDTKKWTDEYPIIRKNPNYYAAAGSKYNTFIAGDHPLIEITNPNPAATNGKTLILVKESYGNALAPFFVDQYAKVCIVDYRFFRSATGKTLPQYAEEVGADEVLFLNYIYATAQGQRLGNLEYLVGIE